MLFLSHEQASLLWGSAAQAWESAAAAREAEAEAFEKAATAQEAAEAAHKAYLAVTKKDPFEVASGKEAASEAWDAALD